MSTTSESRDLYGESDPVERGCALEVAAALRCSQGTAQRFIADAETLVADHPGVLDALESGRINLWAARQIVTATGCLKPQLRRLIDAASPPRPPSCCPGRCVRWPTGGSPTPHIMCNTLVERLTGATKATDAYTTELQVVLTDEALLGTDTTTEGLGTLTKQQLRYRLALQHAAIHTEQPHPALARLPQIFGDRAVATA